MPDTRPNVLVLFTDMQRADTIGALGNEVIRTPTLDRLVREGTAFTRAYTPCPVCVPARWCMHYGRYTTKSGLFANGRMPEDDGLSLPALLGKAGYRTQSVGKCHFTPDKAALRGFDARLLQEECCSDPETDDYCAWLRDRGLDYDEPQGTRGDMYYTPQVSLHDEASHPTTWVADRSIDFLNEKAGNDQPWFLFSSFIHPHPPLAPPKPWHKLYRGPQMPHPNVPEGSETAYTWVNRLQNRYKYRDQGIDRNLVRQIKAYYYATISFVDFQIGRILETLDNAGRLDNTLIVFSSDHGEYLGDFNCFGKRAMHDPSSRIPLLVRYPERFAAGQRVDQPVSLVDVLPTVGAAAGVDTAALILDGLDLAGVAGGSTDRPYVFSQLCEGKKGIYMITSGDWKYVYSAGDDLELLYDLKNDPQESVNLAQVADAQAVKAELKTAQLEFLKAEGQTDAYIETPAGLDWRSYPRTDESYLADPDARLLLQDHDAYTLDRPGYMTV